MRRNPLSSRPRGRGKSQKAGMEKILPARAQKIRELRSAIQNGTYTVDEKVIVEKLLKEILQDVLSSGTR